MSLKLFVVNKLVNSIQNIEFFPDYSVHITLAYFISSFFRWGYRPSCGWNSSSGVVNCGCYCQHSASQEAKLPPSSPTHMGLAAQTPALTPAIWRMLHIPAMLQVMPRVSDGNAEEGRGIAKGEGDKGWWERKPSLWGLRYQILKYPYSYPSTVPWNTAHQ